MSTDIVELDIRGMVPKTYSSSEEQWRKYIFDFAVAEKSRGRIPKSHLRADDSVHFEVSIIFYILPANNPCDIDNLSKPVLDALFLSPMGTSLYKGALYRIDDHQVWKLNLEKRLVESVKDAGVSIAIAFLQ